MASARTPDTNCPFHSVRHFHAHAVLHHRTEAEDDSVNAIAHIMNVNGHRILRSTYASRVIAAHRLLRLYAAILNIADTLFLLFFCIVINSKIPSNINNNVMAGAHFNWNQFMLQSVAIKREDIHTFFMRRFFSLALSHFGVWTHVFFIFVIVFLAPVSHTMRIRCADKRCDCVRRTNTKHESKIRFFADCTLWLNADGVQWP